jgi:hypothetical protein
MQDLLDAYTKARENYDAANQSYIHNLADLLAQSLMHEAEVSLGSAVKAYYVVWDACSIEEQVQFPQLC